MLPPGTLSGDTQQTSFARYAGLLIVLTLILVTFAQLYAFLFMNICNPLTDAAGQVVLHDEEIVKMCVKRLDPGDQAQWALAIGGTLGGTAGWFYRETKKAEVANGNGH
jgi:hypothetical protein